MTQDTQTQQRLHQCRFCQGKYPVNDAGELPRHLFFGSFEKRDQNRRCYGSGEQVAKPVAKPSKPVEPRT